MFPAGVSDTFVAVRSTALVTHAPSSTILEARRTDATWVRWVLRVVPLYPLYIYRVTFLPSGTLPQLPIAVSFKIFFFPHDQLC